MTDHLDPEDVPDSTGGVNTPLELSVTADLPDADASAAEALAQTLETRLLAAWKLLAADRPVPASLSVAIVDDQAMADLHQRYLNEPGPTDVLTFELDHDAAGHVTEGEIVICHGEAARRAAEHTGDVAEELLLYALHGVLHLSGFNDTNPHAYQQMHEMEDQILTRLGIGPVFAGPGSQSQPKPTGGPA